MWEKIAHATTTYSSCLSNLNELVHVRFFEFLRFYDENLATLRILHLKIVCAKERSYLLYIPLRLIMTTHMDVFDLNLNKTQSYLPISLSCTWTEFPLASCFLSLWETDLCRWTVGSGRSGWSDGLGAMGGRGATTEQNLSSILALT